MHLLKQLSKVGLNRFDELKETKIQLRYLRTELESAKLFASKTLTDYDGMKVEQQYFHRLYTKASDELDKVKKEHEEMLANLKTITDKIKEKWGKVFILTFPESEKKELSEQYKFELRLKDEIVSRHQHYIDILRKELIFAKSIIKNPKLLETHNRKMNFGEVDIYDIKTDPNASHNLARTFRRRFGKETQMESQLHTQSTGGGSSRKYVSVADWVKGRSRVVNLNNSKFVACHKSTGPITWKIDERSIKKILESKRTQRELIFQRRNHSVVERTPRGFNISECDNSKLSS